MVRYLCFANWIASKYYYCENELDVWSRIVVDFAELKHIPIDVECEAQYLLFRNLSTVCGFYLNSPLLVFIHAKHK